MKKIVILLSILAGSMSMPSFGVSTPGIGSWVIHPVFSGENATNVVDAGGVVYYLASRCLFRYHKGTQENEALNSGNYLHDNGVKQIYFNEERDNLVVAYESSGIDLIASDGSVSRLDEIKNSSITQGRTINDITFADKGRMVVATGFGWVLYDLSKLEVRESRLFGWDLSSAAIVGSHIVCCRGGEWAVASLAESTELADYAVSSAPAQSGRITPIGETHFFYTAPGGLWLCTLAANGSKPAITSQKIAGDEALTVQMTGAGWVASFGKAGYYYTFAEDGSSPARHDGDELYSSLKNGEWWVLGTQGLALIKGEQKSQYIKPDGIDMSTTPFWLSYDPLMERIILSSTTDNAILDLANNGAKTEIAQYKDGSWTNFTPKSGIPIRGNGHSDGNYRIMPSPHEAGTYFFSTRECGVVKVKGEEVAAVYNTENSPLINRMATLQFDSKGTLWLINARNENTPVIAATKATQQLATVNESNFYKTNNPAVYSKGFKRAAFDIGGNDLKVFSGGQYHDPLVLWTSADNNATRWSITQNSFVDQDSKTVNYDYIYCVRADKNGIVWVGMDNGIIAISPDNVSASSLVVTKIKVPRNDGTSLADYLLDGQRVNCIAVDGSNRKWIGTNGSGVFLVSQDGSQVISNFTTDNSALPSNVIYDLCCDESSGSVFVTTASGVAEYKSDATPAQPDFSNIEVYPNPVRPDFYGTVVIKGLMENSLVKIADASGNPVKHVRSNGGMATWDICNEQGDRVASGVYFIYTSHYNGSTSSAAVAKILVMN